MRRGAGGRDGGSEPSYRAGEMRRGLLAGWADGWRARRLLDSREGCVQALKQ